MTKAVVPPGGTFWGYIGVSMCSAYVFPLSITGNRTQNYHGTPRHPPAAGTTRNSPHWSVVWILRLRSG